MSAYLPSAMVVKVLRAWLKFNARPKNKPITGIILHATAGASAMSSVNWLQRASVKASYHYIIEDDGTVIKCVPYTRRAWHAGKSTGWAGSNCNDYTIGIAFANINDGKEPYQPAAVKACEELCRELAHALPSLSFISTHRLVSPGRKNDPRGFDFKTFCDRVPLTGWKPHTEAWNG